MYENQGKVVKLLQKRRVGLLATATENLYFRLQLFSPILEFDGTSYILMSKD